MRRPKRSESEPRMGEHRNCISAHAVPNMPYTLAARAVSPPMNCSTSRGSTGMMSPIASTSISTVTKMNATVARRGPLGAAAVAWAGGLQRAHPNSSPCGQRSRGSIATSPNRRFISLALAGECPAQWLLK